MLENPVDSSSSRKLILEHFTIMDLMIKSDIFPPLSMEPVEELDRQPDFKDLASKCRIFPFIFFMDNQKVYYGSLPFNKQYQKHFIDLGTALRPTFHNPKYNNWELIDKRLLILITEEKRNSDCRTCFKFNMNNYLVKKAFTTGQRSVEKGTKHVYQLQKAAMRIYYILPQYRKRVEIRYKSFKKEDQYMYHCKKLNAMRNYVIPEGTIYIITTTQNCFFSLHVVKNNVTLPFEALNPMNEPEREFVDKIYRRPVPTPRIECASSQSTEKSLKRSKHSDTKHKKSNHHFKKPSDVKREFSKMKKESPNVKKEETLPYVSVETLPYVSVETLPYVSTETLPYMSTETLTETLPYFVSTETLPNVTAPVFPASETCVTAPVFPASETCVKPPDFPAPVQNDDMPVLETPPTNSFISFDDFDAIFQQDKFKIPIEWYQKEKQRQYNDPGKFALIGESDQVEPLNLSRVNQNTVDDFMTEFLNEMQECATY